MHEVLYNIELETVVYSIMYSETSVEQYMEYIQQ